jgi:hypothetical protein
VIEVTIDEHVAFFRRGPYVINQLVSDVNRVVAGQTLAEWHLTLDRSLKHPTPYYETQIMIEPEGVNTWVVHDRGIVYGPWLEGTSSRNQTTRFKGYHALRRALQVMRTKTPLLVAHELERALSRLR